MNWYASDGAKEARFRAVLDVILLNGLEVKKKPLDKIDAIKMTTDILYGNYGALGLSCRPYPNIHMFGIVPTDVERWFYDSKSLLHHNDKEVDIPDPLRPQVFANCKKILSQETLDLIKQLVRNYSLIAGADLSSWITRIGRGTENISRGNWQIEKYILSYAEDELRWTFNPRLLDFLPSYKKSDSFGSQFGKHSESEDFSNAYTAYRFLKSKLKELAIKEKKELANSGKTWKYRIYKLFSAQDVEMGEEVLYTGTIIKDGNKTFFVDTHYSMQYEDIVRIEDFGIEPGFAYALIGRLVDKNYVVPYGLLKLFSIDTDTKN